MRRRSRTRAGAGETVLLVDDEDAARRPWPSGCANSGYRVLEAADGPAALHLLDGGARIDMLVTDVGLPNGMNGRQLPRRRASGGPDAAAVHHRLRGHELPPGSEVIDKPFELDTLVRRVRMALEVDTAEPAPAAPRS